MLFTIFFSPFSDINKVFNLKKKSGVKGQVFDIFCVYMDSKISYKYYVKAVKGYVKNL